MTILRCGKFIVNKSRHLETRHKLQKRTAEFVAAMSTAFRPVRGRNGRDPRVGMLDVPRPRVERDGPRQPLEMEEPMEILERQVRRQPLEPEVRSNASFLSSSDEEGDTDSDGQEMDIESTRTKSKRFMGPQDVHFQKWKRLIPEGCRPFTVVGKWNKFRMGRAGGSKRPDQQVNNMGYVNRFMADCDFQDFGWKSITPSMVSRHDAELSKHFKANTVARIHQSILDFWVWARNNRYIRRAHYDTVKEYLDGFLRSARKDIIENSKRRVDEAENLPGPEVLQEFEQSEYVTKLRESFRASPSLFLYDMACCLVLLCSFFNVARISVFHNIRFKDVENASTDDGIDYTITVPDKTSGLAGCRSGKAAFITVSKDKYDDLRLYSRTLRDIFKLVDPSATVFRNRAGKPVDTNKLGKMAKRAWTKAGMKVPMSMTILRKLTIVQGRMSAPSMASSIESQLCHRESTADQYYAIHDDRQRAQKVCSHLRAPFSKPSATVTSAEVSNDLAEVSNDSFFADTGFQVPHQESPVIESPASSAPPPEPQGSPMPEMPQLSPSPIARPMAHYSKDVPIISFTSPAKYKQRTRLDPAKRHEIQEAYREVILDYMMQPSRSVPIQLIRDVREGRWPELSEMQLRDIVRNMVKAKRKQDIIDNPDDYMHTE